MRDNNKKAGFPYVVKDLYYFFFLALLIYDYYIPHYSFTILER